MLMRPEVYLATEGEWNFRISRIKTDAWSVIRWHAEHPYIPPRAEILTVDGWCSLLGSTAETRYLNTTEVDQLGTGAFVLPS